MKYCTFVFRAMAYENKIILSIHNMNTSLTHIKTNFISKTAVRVEEKKFNLLLLQQRQQSMDVELKVCPRLFAYVKKFKINIVTNNLNKINCVYQT